MGWIAAVTLAVLALVAAGALVLLAVLIWQGHRKPTGTPNYVALGSSYAAGLGLGAQASGSPIVCQRSVNGYPQQLARMRGLSLVDMSCSGATTTHVLHGGQVFQGPQIDAIRADTELVTITTGGNDVGYVSDLTFMAGRNAPTALGWAIRRIWKGPATARDYRGVETMLLAALREIRRRAPQARIVVVTYPVILPAVGTCAKIGLTADEAATMRIVGERLAEATRAARAGGATIVDMQALAAGHDACSATPWVNGAHEAQGTLFHPTLAGAEATARAVSDALDRST